MSEYIDPYVGVRGTPHVVTLESCAFPLEEGSGGDRTALVLPRKLRRIFEDGAHIVRINSLELARKIPNFGSETSGSYSFLAHKDNFGNDRDPKRYLVLTKASDGARGASTLAFTPDTAQRMLPAEESFFRAQRAELGIEREYNEKFHISQKQYERCFDDPSGYESVIAELMKDDTNSTPETTLRLNVMNYLMRGPSVDLLMEELMRYFGDLWFAERWETGGVLIIDNVAIFHGRYGGSQPPLARNFCI